MECLKCQGLMLVERHYTTMTRHLYARCHQLRILV